MYIFYFLIGNNRNYSPWIRFVNGSVCAAIFDASVHFQCEVVHAYAHYLEYKERTCSRILSRDYSVLIMHFCRLAICLHEIDH